MMIETELLIIGGGTAGLTAAIAAQKAGIQSLVMERCDTAGDCAGESMHPGLAPIAGQLDLLEGLEEEATGRFPGILIRDRDRRNQFAPFGTTDGKPWLGYHIPRKRLARLLVNRARELGATVHDGCKVTGMAPAGKTHVSVTAGGSEFRAKWVFDATGSNGFTARRDRTGFHRASPVRKVAYHYEPDRETGTGPSCTPTLTLKPWGWRWKAPLGNGVTACVNLFEDTHAKAAHHTAHLDNVKYADGSWVVARQPSQDRVYRIGDAALRFDPSSGKGVLRAMMTPMMAVHLLSNLGTGGLTEKDASHHYNIWIRRWFRYEVNMLMHSQSA